MMKHNTEARLVKTKTGDKIYMVPEKQVKPGHKTTEFYTMLGAQALAILVLTGIFTPEQSKALEGAANQIPVLLEMTNTLTGAIISVVAGVYYTFSRTKVKK